uniref:Uncharacterized protein n=1 Tax=Oryza glumipatula TaxID=40148 RepID=A0A0E0AFJ5_9ORYZ
MATDDRPETVDGKYAVGLCPHVTSRIKMPKAYTSVRGVALPWPQWFAYLNGSHGHLDLCGLFVVVNPYLHWLVATEGQIVEDTLVITIETSWLRLN